MKRSCVLLLLLIFFAIIPVFSEDGTSMIESSENAEAPEDLQFLDLPRGYLGVELELGLQELKDRLLEHPYFYYRGDPDVSMLARSEEKLLQVRGLGFIQRGIFQIYREQVYLISLILNPQRIDYYSMFVDLVAKYGEPDDLSPDLAVWQNDQTRLSLERPLTVKYLDLQAFSSILQEASASESLQRFEREAFLEGF